MNTKGLALLPLLASSLFAQYTGEPCSLARPAATFPSLGAAALGVGEVEQIRLIPHSSLPANTVYCAATVTAVGATRFTLQSGTFNTATNAYTRNTDIDPVMTAFPSGKLLALGISDDLRVAVFNTSTGVKVSTRANTTSQFTTFVPVTGITSGYVDPILGRIGSQLSLFVAQSSYTTISVGDLDPTTGAVTNLRVIATGANVHSPTPVNDQSGQTRGVLFVESGSFPHQAKFSSVLAADADVPSKPFFTSRSWIANGDITGGVVTLANYLSFTGDPVRMAICGMTSAYLPSAAPSTLDLVAFGPTQAASATPFVGVTFIGLLAPASIPVGGIVTGNLSLTSMSILNTGVFDNTSGTYTYQLPLPGNLLPPGFKIYTQTALADTTANQIFLSNTAKIQWN